MCVMGSSENIDQLTLVDPVWCCMVEQSIVLLSHEWATDI